MFDESKNRANKSLMVFDRASRLRHERKLEFHGDRPSKDDPFLSRMLLS